jgi:carboxylate-amine ligase
MRSPPGASDYDPGDAYDEAFSAPGEVRGHYVDVLEALGEVGLEEAAVQVEQRIAAEGVTFGGEDGTPFIVDPVPRVFTQAEWHELTDGLRQRVLALDAFLSDVHGERRAIAEGVVPERVIHGSPYLEEDLHGLQPAAGARIAIAGLDVVRGADGHFLVLEDNVRTPSGSAYALAAAEAVEAVLPVHEPHAAAAIWLHDALRRVMEAANPDGDGELVLLSDGPGNAAWYEHRRLADIAGLRLVGLEELRPRGGGLELRDGTRVRSVYRRTDEDRVRDERGELTDLAAVLLPALREGGVGLVNWFGNGVADDKRLYPYVDDLVRLYLGEEPRLRSVPTYDLTDDGTRADVLSRIGDLVVKPRDGYGGEGVTVGATASRAQLAEARETVLGDPLRWIAQDQVALSTHPTVSRGRLRPRHVDFRPFAFCDGEDVVVAPGGLTRVALEEGSLIVNSSRAGGGKATWVLTDP